ncbi:hypothetical protein L6164_006751 [Bauhinia variegata]|uniref:Uncharacterized protein n=1 Tax=Bauhinia variegata TaxID=167791 RepID=A0ACB9PVF3_BAUVA|nr:hypothetical protein L6164_006751 [Bauhinia variegata]
MLGKSCCLILLLITAASLFASHSNSFPLSTNNRWIINSTGQRVKLHCVNWSAHLNAMLVEGLEVQLLKDIVGQVKNLGFNCVRLTWATYMFTRHATARVGETLDSLGLTGVKAGITQYNPFILNMTHVDAYASVVDELGMQGLMVVADNHVSDPKWCCSDNDGNGFFGDKEFNPDEWLQGLSMVANRFRGKAQVVAMSLRNELRGPNQNQNAWYNYMSQGATTVHQANPDVLVIVSGLSYDLDLSFLKTKPLGVNIGNKLVHEAHLYAWSRGSADAWTNQPVNRVCSETIQGLNDRAGFLMSGPNPVPLFMSEFGFDMRRDQNSDRFLSCVLSFLAGVDLDWALWTLQGSYYIRQAAVTTATATLFEEEFGVLNDDWKTIRYPEFPHRFQLVEKMLQDPSSSSPNSYIMFHPMSGQCVQANNNEVEVGDCGGKTRWIQQGQQIKVVDTGLCMKAVGDGSSPILSNDCSSEQSSWQTLSASNLHLGASDGHGQTLCMQRESPSSSKIVTTKCICVDDDPACLDNPQSQWFRLVSTNVD